MPKVAFRIWTRSPSDTQDVPHTFEVSSSGELFDALLSSDYTDLRGLDILPSLTHNEERGHYCPALIQWDAQGAMTAKDWKPTNWNLPADNPLPVVIEQNVLLGGEAERLADHLEQAAVGCWEMAEALAAKGSISCV